MDTAAVRAGIASVIQAAIPALNVHDYAPDSLTAPALFVAEETVDYDQAFGSPGLTEVVFTLNLCLTRGDPKDSHKALAAYLSTSGSSSIKHALLTDRTLAASASESRLESVKGHAFLSVGGTDYLGAQFTLRVWG